MKVWRIAAETRSYGADDISGVGASIYPGRWNDKTEPIVYSAPTRSLAVLETSAHVNPGGLPLNKYLVEIEIPDAVWAKREEPDVALLPVTWDAIPAGRASVQFGSAWLASLRSALLLVPSVILPEERAVLINPRHPDSAAISAKAVRRFEYDAIFRVSGKP